MNAQFLKENPIFWSRLGGEWYPPLFDPDGKPYYGYTEGQIPTLQRYHRDFAAAGVHTHSIILDGGWIGEDTYDYRVTDLQLKQLFEADPSWTHPWSGAATTPRSCLSTPPARGLAPPRSRRLSARLRKATGNTTCRNGMKIKRILSVRSRL